MRTFAFKVKLKHDKRVWRRIETLGTQTLDDMHKAIQEAYGFDDDHLYSYFMSGKAWDLSDFEYHHPDASPQTPVEERMRALASKIRVTYPEPRLPATKKSVESLNLESRRGCSASTGSGGPCGVGSSSVYGFRGGLERGVFGDGGGGWLKSVSLAQKTHNY